VCLSIGSINSSPVEDMHESETGTPWAACGSLFSLFRDRTHYLRISNHSSIVTTENDVNDLDVTCAKVLCCEEEILVGNAGAKHLPNSSNAVGGLYRAPTTLETTTTIGMVCSEKVYSLGFRLVGDIEPSPFLVDSLHRRQTHCSLSKERFFLDQKGTIQAENGRGMRDEDVVERWMITIHMYSYNMHLPQHAGMRMS
jgi:hypothetical protein